jgi:hypothetical protein
MHVHSPKNPREGAVTGLKYFSRLSRIIMAETTEQRVGIDRCESPLQTAFALAMMELGKFEWRGKNSHEWEVGRWPGLRLTLLAQPQWGPYTPHFAICPLPQNGYDVPFLLFLAIGGRIESSYVNTGDTSVTLLYLTMEQVRRDVAACAFRAFDLAIQLQSPHLGARFVRLSQPCKPILPCMKTMMTIQHRFTSLMSAFELPGALAD